MRSMPESLVPQDAVTGTIDAFTQYDKDGDHGAMNALAQRLNREQPALLKFAARLKQEQGDASGEAAVFYGTLVWAIFDRAFGRRLPRLILQNLSEAQKVVDEERGAIPDLKDRPVHERVSPGLFERQPHLMAKLQELLADDVKENAITVECADAILGPTQVIVEAFDAALAARRPGHSLHPVVREEPKVGRNEPCPCGSGKKWKRCHGAQAA